jgi:hypothetical protein
MKSSLIIRTKYLLFNLMPLFIVVLFLVFTLLLEQFYGY